MDRSAVIIAAPITEKGIPEREGKALVNITIGAIEEHVDEIVLVADSQADADAYTKVVVPDIKVVVNSSEDKGSLAAAAVGFEAASGEYTLVLPSGSIYLSEEVVSLLLDCAPGKAAVVPRWTDQRIEALHAVYHTKEALAAAKAALSEGEFELAAVVGRLRGVRYISTMVIEQIDPSYESFRTVTSSADPKSASLPKPKPTAKKGKKPRL